MTRAFTPLLRNPTSEFYLQNVEARITDEGKPAYHLPVNGDQQLVYINYHYIPNSEARAGDPTLEASDPMIYGLVQHFDVQPKRYVKNKVQDDKGSQFEIEGFIFNVKSVEVNHHGGFMIRLVRDDLCAEQRQDFFDEVAQEC